MLNKKVFISLMVIGVFYEIIFMFGYIFGYNPFILSNYCRWDSGLYNSICEHGYFIETIEGSNNLNGNCGWFPLLPAVCFLLKVILGVNFEMSAFGVSALFSFACIMGILQVTRYEKDTNPLWCSIFFMFWIGGIYWAAAFPMSMCCFWGIVSIYYVLNKKYFISGIFCFIACMSYSTAFLLCGILGIYIIIEAIKENVTFKKFVVREILSPVMGFMGFIAVQLIIYAFTSNIQAFFLTQKKYGHGIHNPVKTIKQFLSNLTNENIIDSLQSFSSLLFLGIFIFVSIVFIIYKMYDSKVYTISYISICVSYVFLLIMGNGVSPYRQYLLGANASIILGSKKINLCVKILLLIIMLFDFVINIKLFLDGIIV